MKLLVVTAMVVLAGCGIIIHLFPQVGHSLPLADTISTMLDSTGLSKVPVKLFGAGMDLTEAAKTREFGAWHLIVIVLCVLVARKTLMWLLR
jgi:hypothetical protein